MRRQIIVAVAAVALVGGAAAALSGAQSSLAVTSSTTSSTAVTDAQKTQRVFADTNEVRAEAGTTPLVRNAALDKVASDWAYQQWKNGAMSHNPNYSTQIPAGWSHAGENVAAGYDDTQVTPAWTASAEHYKNLVGDYTDIGIGFYQGPDGKIYWTQEFGKYSTTTVPPKQTPNNAPSSTPSAPASSAPASSAPASSAPASSGTAAGEPAAPAGTAIALSSPSFEGSSAGWTASGAALDGPNTNAKGGKFALAVNGGQTVSQTVSTAVTAGETDTVTIWVKPGSTGAVAGQLKLTAVGGTTETATTSFSVSSGWMKVSVGLPVAKAGHTGLRIDVVLSNSGRSYRLDSASLVRTKNAPATSAPAGTPPAAPASPASPPSPTPTKPAAAAPAPTASPAPKPTQTPTAPAPSPASSSSLRGLLGLLGLGG
ncbi:MAG TPA: CAP domain-containing protein [Pseudolysinimonas sp.]|jgi:uncharacterized protein YkwD